jgi:3-oxoacyl-[acyl-carrier protein] reductase
VSKEKPLAGQVAWVTGSSRGLGRVIATELCKRGAAVALHGTRFDSPRSFGEGESMEQVARDVAAEAGGTAVPVWGDVTDEAEVKRMADAVRARLGPIDILVANAGGDIGAGGTGAGRGGRPGSDDCVGISLADIRAVLDRNLLSCVLCCREVAPEMMARRRGRIITVGSIAGTFGRDDGTIYAVGQGGGPRIHTLPGRADAPLQRPGQLRRAGRYGDESFSGHPRHRPEKADRGGHAGPLRSAARGRRRGRLPGVGGRAVH